MNDMDMSGGMGDVSDMDDGTIDVTWIPQVYWIFIGAAIAAVSLINLFNHVMYWQRMRALPRRKRDPASPQNPLSGSFATLVALSREISNLSLPNLPRHFRIFGYTVQSPSFGSCFIVVAHTILLLILGFYRLDPTNYDNFQNIAYRWGFLTLGQLPLVYLLAGKENLIGFFTGHSYERLNWLHRWVARCIFLTATLHMGFWFGNWAPYDYIGHQVKHDRNFTQTGLAAWCILAWIVITSVAPIRGLSHELFVLQHLISFTAFLTMVFLHTPTSDHTWLWIPVGVFFFDRLLRWIWLGFNSLSFFHQRKTRRINSIFACHAELTPLPGIMTRITIRDPPLTWRPGQYVHLSFLSISPLQSHPFTIATLPSDGKMEFVIKAHRGGTRRLFDVAQKRFSLPRSSTSIKSTDCCMVSNSYGSMRPLQQFDSVVLVAGSAGASFTVPLLRDVIRRWRTSGNAQGGAVTRRIRFIWVVKSGEHISWFATQLKQALTDVRKLRGDGLDVRLKLSIYVTCDEAFTMDWSSSRSPSDQTKSQKDMGVVESYTPMDNSEITQTDEKKLGKAEQEQTVREIDPRSDSTSSSESPMAKPRACQPDGTCCCQTTVTDEKLAPNFTCKCQCGATKEAPLEDVRLESVDLEERDPVRALANENAAVVSGRPHPKTIIRRTLERARGESAVVVCGPHTLNNDVRRAVVQLSNERAAGRSTGAQGVWFWGEGFGY